MGCKSIYLETGTFEVLINHIVIVVVEVGDQFDGVLTKSISTDGDCKSNDHA